MTIDPTAAVLTCVIVATDSASETVNTSFSITFVANSLPTIVTASGSVTIEITVPYNRIIDIPSMFNDTDANQTLTYSVTNVPGYLTSVVNTNHSLSLSGTAEATDVGSVGIEITADDGYNNVTDTFTITVVEYNNPPTINTLYVLDDISDYVGPVPIEIDIADLFIDIEALPFTYEFEDENGKFS